MTIQWGQKVSTHKIRSFDKKLSRSLREHSLRFGHQLRFYSIKEIDARNLIHAHVLVCTDMGLDAVKLLFDDRCRRLSNSVSAVTFCEPVRESSAVSRYVTKDLVKVRNGQKKLCLFEPGLVRLRTQMQYLEPWRVGELRKDGRKLWIAEAKRHQLAIGGPPLFDGYTDALLQNCSTLTIDVDANAYRHTVGAL